MLWEEVLYGWRMTAMILALRARRRRATHWVVNVVADGVVWISVLAAASGLGLLLEAIVDTVRYGHPR